MANFGDGNLIIQDAVTNKTYRLSGFSSTVLDSFVQSGTGSGVEVSGHRIMSREGTRMYLYSGFGGAVLDSFISPAGLTDVTHDTSRMVGSRSNGDKIHKYSGFTGVAIDSFAAPSTNPVAVSWDGSNIISANFAGTALGDKVYLHSGFSSTIKSNFATLNVNGVTWDGTNLIVSKNTGVIIKYSGFSSTVLDSFAWANQVVNVAWDNRTLASFNIIRQKGDIFKVAGTKVYQLSGYTATVKDSVTLSYTPSSMAITSAGEIITGETTKVRKHVGLSAVVADSFSYGTQNIRGITWDGTDVIVGNNVKILKFAGFSSTVTASFATPTGTNAYPQGLSWFNGNLWVGSTNRNKIYKMVGFSATISTEWVATGVESLMFDGANFIWANSTDPAKYLMYVGERENNILHDSLTIGTVQDFDFGSLTTTSTSTSTTTTTSTSTSTTTTTSTSTSTSTSTTTSTSTSTSTTTTVDAGGPPQPADYPSTGADPADAPALTDSPTAGPEGLSIL
ncbi:hypothetical protein GW915_11770 [bacterium]|nr:hypothetical protein [bacterium]